MSVTIFVCEVGIILVDEELRPVTSTSFSDGDTEEFLQLTRGVLTPKLKSIIAEGKERGNTKFAVNEEALVETIRKEGLDITVADDTQKALLNENKIRLIIDAKIFSSEGETIQEIRKKAILFADRKIRQGSESLDLHLINGILSLDDIDRMINLLAERLREWYGLHFPELFDILQDLKPYCRYIIAIGTRDDQEREKLDTIGLGEKKTTTVLSMAGRSKGGTIRPQEMDKVRILAQEIESLSKARDNLYSYVENTMEDIAINVSHLAGPMVGARLLARAGGLERLSRMPSSTIQVLGAEKALFRSLRTGSRPPKHGILFQHQAIHSAPKWQRGKVARSLAAKIAIAARIDQHGGGRNIQLEEDLKKRIDEVKNRYKDPPKDSGRFRINSREQSFRRNKKYGPRR